MLDSPTCAMSTTSMRVACYVLMLPPSHVIALNGVCQYGIRNGYQVYFTNIAVVVVEVQENGTAFDISNLNVLAHCCCCLCLCAEQALRGVLGFMPCSMQFALHVFPVIVSQVWSCHTMPWGMQYPAGCVMDPSMLGPFSDAALKSF